MVEHIFAQSVSKKLCFYVLFGFACVSFLTCPTGSSGETNASRIAGTKGMQDVRLPLKSCSNLSLNRPLPHFNSGVKLRNPHLK